MVEGRRNGLPGSGGPVAGMDGIGAYLRNLRERQKLTQDELAARSLATPHPFDRTYVARQEAGELAGSATRFLTYLSVLRASVDKVSEMLRVSAQLPENIEELTVGDLLERSRREETAGRYEEAFGWALAAVQRGVETGSAEDQARGLVAAAIVLGNQGSWELALELCRGALNLAGVSARTAARAAIRAAESCLSLGEPVTAEAFLSLISVAELERDTALAAMRWHVSGIIKRVRGDFTGALDAFRIAASRYGEKGSARDEARMVAVEARIALSLGRSEEAAALAEKALDLARASEHEMTIARVQFHAGRVVTACGDPDRGRELLLEAEGRAREIGDDVLLFEIRLWLYDAARRIGDRALEGLLKRRLKADRGKLILDPEEAGAFERLFGPPSASEEER